MLSCREIADINCKYVLCRSLQSQFKSYSTSIESKLPKSKSAFELELCSKCKKLHSHYQTQVSIPVEIQSIKWWKQLLELLICNLNLQTISS